MEFGAKTNLKRWKGPGGGKDRLKGIQDEPGGQEGCGFHFNIHFTGCYRGARFLQESTPNQTRVHSEKKPSLDLGL